MPDPAPMIQRTIELATADGVMRGAVAVNSGPMRLTGLVKTAYALTDALVQHASAAEAAAGRAISCRAGCGACCRHMVPVSPPEALYLMDVIESLEPGRRAPADARFAEIVSALEARGMIPRLLDPTITSDPFVPVAREYFSLQLACPFLVDESCSLHAHRPVACRDYNVTSPAAWCSRPYEHDIAKVPMPLPLSAPLARAAARLTGQPARLIPLTLVPRWAAEHADLREQTWPGPELFDVFIDELAQLYPPSP